MSDDTAQVRVNFNKPFPLFPLERVSLLPHAVLPLLIFEPRYRQMVQDALDDIDQIAMAVYERGESDGAPTLLPAVCIGRIVQWDTLPEQQYRILVQGVCRARIVEAFEPDGERLYRTAMLEPTGVGPIDEPSLAPARESILRILGAAPLTDLVAGDELRSHLRQPDMPTSAVMEIITLSVLGNPDVQYRLLAEGDASRRAEIIEAELLSLASLIDVARRQDDPEAPKGVVWN